MHIPLPTDCSGKVDTGVSWVDWISYPLPQEGSDQQVYLVSVLVSAISKWHKIFKSLSRWLPRHCYSLLARTKSQFSLWRRNDFRTFWELQRNQIPTSNFSREIETTVLRRNAISFLFYFLFILLHRVASRLWTYSWQWLLITYLLQGKKWRCSGCVELLLIPGSILEHPEPV